MGTKIILKGSLKKSWDGYHLNRHYLLGQLETLASMLQAAGIWRAKVVLIGRPIEGSVLSLMRTHKHLGLLAFSFWVSWQHSDAGFFAVPLTKGMQDARFVSCSAHSCSSSSIVAIDAIANEAITMQNIIIILSLPISMMLLVALLDYCYYNWGVVFLFVFGHGAWMGIYWGS